MRIVLFPLLSIALMQSELPHPDKLPAIHELPDPLVCFDGKRVATAKEWKEKRNPELKKLFQHYVYGQFPEPRAVRAKIVHVNKNAYDGKATLQEIELRISAKAPPVYLLLVVPNVRSQPAPVFVGMNFEGNHGLVDDPMIRIPNIWMYPSRPGVKNNRASEAGRGKSKDVWAIDQSIERGYAVATFYSGDVDPDLKDQRGGWRPYVDPDEKAGTIAFWAWGIHRVVDYLVTRDDLDARRIAVVGHSRLGKTALLAAAFDDRIALAIPNQAGCGGTAPSRGKVGESVARINSSFPHWFNDNFKKFSGQPERLPLDQHCLVALCAPRPVLFTNAEKDTWANPEGQFEVLRSAEPVYRLLKAGGLASEQKPSLGKLSAGTLGYYVRPGMHSMTRGDWKVYLDFAELHLEKAKSRSQNKKKLLLIGQGADGHPAGTHEYVKGLNLLARGLRKVPNLEVTTVRADGKWPEGPELIDRADGVVLFLAEGAKWVSEDKNRLRAFQRLVKRGGGRVTLHWAMGTRTAGPIQTYLELFGGCHGGADRKYKIVERELLLDEHPITAGLSNFKIKDEFYYRLKFAKPMPESVVRIHVDDEIHVVGWATESRGRAFGFSGLHFHDNWKRSEYRRLITQGVLWSVGVEIPKAGLAASIIGD